ncbi:hypothetical protein SLE2022_250350 [Rubroshorea leprosula]
MEATTVDVVAEIPKTEQGSGAKNSHTSTAESGGKKPLVVAVVAAAADADGSTSAGSSPTSVLPSQRKKNRVQVSNNKKPFVFYLNIAKKYLKLYNDVELSALGMAIPTVVTIAEILKRNGQATEKRITISTIISPKENEMGRQIEKAKIEIVLEKVEKFDKTSSVDVATVLKDSDKGASSAA